MNYNGLITKFTLSETFFGNFNLHLFYEFL